MKLHHYILSSIFACLILNIQDSKAQIGTGAVRLSADWNGTFGYHPKIGIDYQFKERNLLRLEGNYFVEKDIGYRNAQWGVGIGHVYVMGLSKKFPGLTTWYTGQSLEYREHQRNHSGKELSHSRNLAMNLSIGRQFNLSKSFSFFTEIGIAQSIYSRIDYPNLPPFNPNTYRPGQITESRIDESFGTFGSGWYFKTGLIYRFPIKK